MYYPGDPINSAWLKTAVLFWDSIQTIANQNIQHYDNPNLQYLAEVGILNSIPFNGINVSFETIDYFDSEELFSQCFSTVPVENSSRKKLNDKFKHHINQRRISLGLDVNDSVNYYLMPDFAALRMTFFANKMCENYSLAPVTNTEFINFFNSIRRGQNLTQQGNSEQGLLFDLAISDLYISPECSLKKIIRFKNKYKDELSLFRTQIAKLAQNIPQNQSFEAIIEDVNNSYKNEFLPTYNNFKKALKGFGVKWFLDNIFKVFTMSVSTTSIPMIIGKSNHQALLIGAGITLTTSRIAYSADKRKFLRENPNSYLLATEKKYRKK
ncbi:MAG: DUF6236 family protein [Oscillospiraceae bacterium]|nr:DUF6236 family protein [Oscillospiraceae bacterium]